MLHLLTAAFLHRQSGSAGERRAEGGWSATCSRGGGGDFARISSLRRRVSCSLLSFANALFNGRLLDGSNRIPNLHP